MVESGSSASSQVITSPGAIFRRTTTPWAIPKGSALNPAATSARSISP